MDQTPVHERHNPDLLASIPARSRRLIEVGCSSGALAREFKRLSPDCHYLGIDISSAYVSLARRHCDEVMVLDIDAAPAAFFETHRDADCWIFGDTLEHLRDPWRILGAIRRDMPSHGCVVACLPNAQHWSVQLRLATGEFWYEDAGLLDRTHLRFFTRKTMIRLFESAGFRIDQMFGRVFPEPDSDAYIGELRASLATLGLNAEEAVADAKPLQFVLRGVPA